MVWEMDEDTKHQVIYLFESSVFRYTYSLSYPFFGSKWWANIQQLNVFKLTTASIKKTKASLRIIGLLRQ